MKILLIEDDEKKMEDLSSHIQESFDIFELIIKKSYQSGLRELIRTEYDLLLLDMSIPTWDKTIDEPGGNFEKFGGYKILREIKRKKRTLPTILVTMFDDFGESDTSITISQLNDILLEEFPKIYNGVVYYNAGEDGWKTNLNSFLGKFIEKT